MHCLVCGMKLETCVCPRCSFDQSLCRELYPTVGTDKCHIEPLWAWREALFGTLTAKTQELDRSRTSAEEASRLTQQMDVLKKRIDLLTSERDDLQRRVDTLSTGRGTAGSCPSERDILRGKVVWLLAERLKQLQKPKPKPKLSGSFFRPPAALPNPWTVAPAFSSPISIASKKK